MSSSTGSVRVPRHLTLCLVCTSLSVYTYMYACTPVYLCVCLCNRGQRSPLDVIHFSPFFFFETGYVTGLELIKSAWLVGHQTPGILVGCPQHWACKHAPPTLAFTWLGVLRSDPFSWKEKILSTSVSSQPSPCFYIFFKQHKITFGLSYSQHLLGAIMDLQSCVYIIWQISEREWLSVSKPSSSPSR